MASNEPKPNRGGSPHIFDCEMIPLPPGTKSRGRLPRGMEPEPLPRRAWWLLGGAVVVSLVIGVMIGRFLLP